MRRKRSHRYTRHTKQYEIAGFRKGWEANYSTSVTATKGEKIALWGCVLLMLCAVLASLLLFKSMLAFTLCTVGGMLLIFGVMIFCIFRPKHKEERMQNAAISSGKVDEVWVNLPWGKQPPDHQ